MRFSTKTAGLTVALILLSSIAVEAHVPFLKPNMFHITSNRLTIESAFTEDPFVADFAMVVPQFYMLSPDGQLSTLQPTAKTRGAHYLEPDITMEGTYRFATGMRKGPRYTAIETADGKLYFSQDTLTTVGTKVKMQYYSSADVYIVNGKSNYKPTLLKRGVEIIPLSDPNAYEVGHEMAFQVFRDGKEVPHARVVVAQDGEKYRFHRTEDYYDVEDSRKSNITTDEQGKFALTPKEAGLMMLFVTVHEKLEDGNWDSFNASLTIEVNLEGFETHHH